MVARTVMGIISYTRWPSDRPSLTLCVLAAPQWADDLLHPPGSAGGHTVQGVRLSSLADPQLSSCDVLYAGPLAPADARALYQRIAGQAVLTIAEEDPSCATGSMFCLKMRDDHVAFQINIDAVSRGGVRVNPQVLQLGQRDQATAGVAPR